MKNLDSLFNPKSIAIVGASSDPTKIGSTLLLNVINSGFSGNIYPINPKYEELYGLKCYKNLSSIEENIDVVCIAIPKEFVKEIIKEAAENRVKNAVIITAGFSEVGEEGRELEKDILRIAQTGGLSIVGPNCLGYFSSSAKLNLSFASSTPIAGNVAFLSQSGAFCTALLDMSIPKNLGFSHLVSIGNKSDINEIDLLENFIADERVKVIGMYLEEIKNGIKFVEIAKKSTKPIILLKPGESNEAKEAIASHTGSLAGSKEIIESACSKAGVIKVNSIKELFNTLNFFSFVKNFESIENIAILTNAGGPGIIATDSIVRNTFKLAKLSKSTVEELKANLPTTANTHNPVDVIGDSLADRYKISLDLLEKDENVDAVLVLLTPQKVTQIEETAKAIIQRAIVSEKPILPCFLGEHHLDSAFKLFYENRIPSFIEIEESVQVLVNLRKYERSLANKDEIAESSNKSRENSSEMQAFVHMNKGSTPIPEELVHSILAEHKVDVPKQRVVNNLADALDFADKLYPLAIKALSEDLPHKTELKAVFLNIKDRAELKKRYRELSGNLAKVLNRDNPRILVQEFIESKQQFFIGANRDGDIDVYETKQGFGHILALGHGGIYTEVYKDIATVLVPASLTELLKALETTKIWKIIKGFRGEEPLAIRELLLTLAKIQDIILSYPEIKSIDINPVLLTRSRAVAVDVKMYI